MARPVPRLIRTALVVALSLTAACGAATEKVTEAVTEGAIEAAGGGDVDIDLDRDGGGYTVETEDGSLTSGTGRIPTTWPSDVRLPELRDVASTEVSDAVAGSAVTLTGVADGSAEDVLRFFADALVGWTEASRTDLGGEGGRTVQVAYERGTRTVLVATFDDGDAVTVTLSHSETL